MVMRTVVGFSAFLMMLSVSWPGKIAAEIVAGQGVPDSTYTGLTLGDGGPAALAQLMNPFDAAFDGSGNLFIVDTSQQRIRRVDRHGIIETVAGTGRHGDLAEAAWARDARFADPMALCIDASGRLFVSDTFNHRVRRIDPDGRIWTIAGTGRQGTGGDGGRATEAELSNPSGLAVGLDGVIYIADQGNHRIRRVDASGVISTAAGTGNRGYSGDGGAALQASLADPSGVAVDANGVIYIADRSNHAVRAVDVFGVIQTMAGNGVAGFGGDGGAASEAQLRIPSRVACDARGDLYVADRGNNRIRRIDRQGNITTVLGGDEVLLARPFGVSVSPFGDLVVIDTENHVIRSFRPTRAAYITRERAEILGDGRDDTGILVALSDLADGLPVRFRIVSGEGKLAVTEGRTSGGLAGTRLQSDVPGTVTVQASVEGALSVNADVMVTPVRHIELTASSAKFAANAADFVQVEAVASDGDASILLEIVTGAAVLEVDALKNGGLVGRLSASTPGAISLRASAPGAFSQPVTVYAVRPEPWQVADAYESDDTREVAPTVGVGRFEHTFHTTGDTDWMRISRRPGYAKTLRAEADLPVLARVYDESGNLVASFSLPGEIPPGNVQSDSVWIALSQPEGLAGAYAFQVAERRAETIDLSLGRSLVADGIDDGALVVRILDASGRVNALDDTTRVQISVPQGEVEASNSEFVVVQGIARVALRAFAPGEVRVRAEAAGIPAVDLLVSVLPALVLEREGTSDGMLEIPLSIAGGVDGLTGIQARVGYDASVLAFDSFSPEGLLKEGTPILDQTLEGIVEVNLALLGASVQERVGRVGRLRFRVVGNLAAAEDIVLIDASYGVRGGGIRPFGIGRHSGRVKLAANTASFEAWLAFRRAFGARQGDPAFDPKWDLDGDGAIGFADFVLWIGK